MRSLAIVVLAVCGVLLLGGEISGHHRAQGEAKSDGSKQSTSQPRGDVTKHGITELGLERKMTRGLDPAYTFTVTSDGKVRFFGKSTAIKKGTHTGTVSVDQFNRLAQFVSDMNFAGLDDTYFYAKDVRAYITTAVISGTRKTVYNQDGYGPSKLWAIQELMDALMGEVTWDPVRNP